MSEAAVEATFEPPMEYVLDHMREVCAQQSDELHRKDATIRFQGELIVQLRAALQSVSKGQPLLDDGTVLEPVTISQN